ncbi:DUF1934 domain-containing protein [Furfurilactobacillus entadae]|uniref:DUF1934 domain-containing protein n=1 Tax=Furfurilactobacillus entadae TaxID=2922307 RepID=UPI0035EE8D85
MVDWAQPVRRGNLSEMRYNFLLAYIVVSDDFNDNRPGDACVKRGMSVSERLEQGVTVHLVTNIKQDGETETFDFTVPGRLILINGSAYLRYAEEDQGKTTQVTFKLNGHHDVLLTRSGETGLRLHFLAGKAVKTTYQTAYGPLNIEVATSGLNAALADDLSSGRINVDYQLLAGESLLGDYQIRLQFTA